MSKIEDTAAQPLKPFDVISVEGGFAFVVNGERPVGSTVWTYCCSAHMFGFGFLCAEIEAKNRRIAELEAEVSHLKEVVKHA